MQLFSATGATLPFTKVRYRIVGRNRSRFSVGTFRLLWRSLHPGRAVVMPKVYGVARECRGAFPVHCAPGGSTTLC